MCLPIYVCCIAWQDFLKQPFNLVWIFWQPLESCIKGCIDAHRAGAGAGEHALEKLKTAKDSIVKLTSVQPSNPPGPVNVTTIDDPEEQLSIGCRLVHRRWGQGELVAHPRCPEKDPDARRNRQSVSQFDLSSKPFTVAFHGNEGNGARHSYDFKQMRVKFKLVVQDEDASKAKKYRALDAHIKNKAEIVQMNERMKKVEAQTQFWHISGMDARRRVLLPQVIDYMIEEYSTMLKVETKVGA